MCINKDYWFTFDEPLLIQDNIICAFHIANINKKRGFFFIVKRKERVILLYSIINITDLMELAKECSLPENKENKIAEIVETADFQKKYNKRFLKEIEIKDSKTLNLLDTILKMDLSKGKNDMHGLDGFSIEIKKKKSDKAYYSWCHSNDKDYFPVIDFANYIFDLLNIDKDYRFIKYT